MYFDLFNFYFRQIFEVSNAIYGSKWYEGSIEVKKLIYFVLMRSQKTFVVYSGFYEANLNTFSSVSSKKNECGLDNQFLINSFF